ncbi:MAG: hypothetical protein IJ009_00040 [Clostridia bacterium]|nr:hypothetical protein [Clostridia bacterium]
MAVYRLADLNIEILPRYQHIVHQCKDYLAPDGTIPDVTVEVPKEDLDRIMEENPRFGPGYLESIEAYRRLCTAVLPFDAFFVHAAVVEVDGRAYAFSAASGTGKSTHISLWREVFGERVHIINGDKPILRRSEGGGFTAYGTPWCGKEGWHENRSAPLCGICFLERSQENYIRPLAPGDALDRIFSQLLRPKTRHEADMTLTLTDRLLREVPMWVLGCNISHEAAELSFRTLTAKK